MTLTEVLLAVAILALLVAPVIDLVLLSGRANAASINEIVFTNLANELADGLVHADAAFLQQAVSLSSGNWVNLLALEATKQRLYLQSEIPEQAHEVAFSLSQPPGQAGWALRVRVHFIERGEQREVRLARYLRQPVP
ncbi:MAG: hypothetical protein HY816_13740 [Candidatus Wallbacteria bacterium]|nr:hypothetical protein [Candidatus Wallbacteria bacterium]